MTSLSGKPIDESETAGRPTSRPSLTMSHPRYGLAWLTMILSRAQSRVT